MRDDGRHQLMACGFALLFDDELHRQVREVQGALRLEGIEPELLYPPHVTLWVSAVPHTHMAPETASHLARLAPIDVTLGSLGCFAVDDCVVFLAPLPSVALLEVHAAAITHAQAAGVDVDPYYLPESWVPHCTLATGIEAARMPDVIRVVSRLQLPLRGRLVEGALIDGPSGDVIDRRQCSG